MKRLSKILCISVIAAIQLTLKVDAQTKFHDVELNDAAGPVKEMTINLGISKNTFKFSRNGKIEQYEGLVDTGLPASITQQAVLLKKCRRQERHWQHIQIINMIVMATGLVVRR